jgi:hypothetical protein
LADSNLPPAALRSLKAQHVKLAAVAVPEELDRTTKQEIQQAIAESFVHGYRLIMVIGATLAVVSAIVAWLFIRGAPSR